LVFDLIEHACNLSGEVSVSFVFVAGIGKAQIVHHLARVNYVAVHLADNWLALKVHAARSVAKSSTSDSTYSWHWFWQLASRSRKVRRSRRIGGIYN
jgi:hypothetical protein